MPQKMSDTIQKVKSVCPYCGVGCGVVLHVENNRVLSVEGDRDHPVNKGKLCTKGASSHIPVSHEDRLSSAYIRSPFTDKLEAVTRAEAIDQAAQQLRSLIEKYGPSAVSIYSSGQLTIEAQYVLTKLAKGFIRTPYVESNSRLCMAAAGTGYKYSLGADAPPGSYEDFDTTDLFFVTGSNMADCHPILFLRMMARVRKGAKLIVVDPRRTPVAEKADLFLQIKPGTDLALLNGLLHLLIKNNYIDYNFIKNTTEGWEQLADSVSDYSVSQVAYLTGLAACDIEQAAHMIGQTPLWLSCWTMGLNQSVQGARHTMALCNLHLATGSICKPGAGPFSLTGQPNAMGGREMGYMGLGLPGQRTLADRADRGFVEQIWGLAPETLSFYQDYGTIELFNALGQGKIKACWIICTNPVATIPHRQKVQNALQEAELVIVQDVFAHNETLPFADIILPGALLAETQGVMVNSERRMTLAQQAVLPPGEAAPDWKIIVEMAHAMGFEKQFPYQSAEEIFEEIRQFSNRKTGYNIEAVTYDNLNLSSIQWPAPRNDDPYLNGKIRYLNDGKSQDVRLSDSGEQQRLNFPTSSGKAYFQCCPFIAPMEPVDAQFNFVLNSGRVQHQWHTLTKTGKVESLNQLNAHPYVDIHPYDAKALNIEEGDKVELRSRRGCVVLPARVTDSVQKGSCFAPFHWNDCFGQDLAVNSVTSDDVDALSLQPGFKYCSITVVLAEKKKERNSAQAENLRQITVGVETLLVWASQTGRTHKYALMAQEKLQDAGLSCLCVSMNEVSEADLLNVKTLLVMTSTFGDGDAPDNGRVFWTMLSKWPSTCTLENLSFSVMAFGDRSYAQFCKFGQNVEQKLQFLGAQVLVPCRQNEHDETAAFAQWLSEIIGALSGKSIVQQSIDYEYVIADLKKSGSEIALSPTSLVLNRPLNGKGSTKDVRHYVFDTSQTSLTYNAGDSLGVKAQNDPAHVKALLKILKLPASQVVKVEGKGEMTLQTALTHHKEISRLTKQFIEFVYNHTKEPHLEYLLREDRTEECHQWMWPQQIMDVLHRYPVTVSAQEVVNVLPPLRPRFYSISSSPAFAPQHIHLTVSTLRYHYEGKLRGGVCSTYLADRAREVEVFVQHSPHFRLPADLKKPVIMVGAGTGIAPFRAFMQERRAVGATGKNWIFFGEQSQKSDFYYKDEWNVLSKEGYLHRIDTAFSRDQERKIYVQHRMMEQGKELWKWLEEGACFYVCGDARYMARDVEETLHNVIHTYGQMSMDKARDYLDIMSQEQRYLKDIY